MQQLSTVVFLLSLVAVTTEAAEASPISKVLQLMDELSAKISADGAAADKAYSEYFEWCDDTTKNQQNEIKTYSAKKEKLTAEIAELTSSIDDAGDSIEKLVAKLSKFQKELDEATAIREKEAKDFAAAEGELMDAVDMLARAVDIISREMAKGGSFAQQAQQNRESVAGLLQSLSLVTEAGGLSGADQEKLAALVQEQDGDSTDDGDLGAPAAASYKSKSGGIVDLLEDMKEKAEGQLAAARKSESTNKANYMRLKQGLEGKMGADGKELDEKKTQRAADSEAKATAAGDLEVTTRALASTQEDYKTTAHGCIQVAADHQQSVKDLKEELNVIANAKKIIVESTGDAAAASAASFLQVGARSRSGSDVPGMVTRLARKQHSAALAQLASRIETVLRLGGSSGEDPFAKVKGLIGDMIGKLKAEADSDAEEKAFCDEAMAKTEAKKGELDEDSEKLAAGIEDATAKSTKLKEEVTELQKELAKLMKEQKELDDIRSEQNKDYLNEKADLDKALAGVQKALEVLQEYYASEDGSSSSLLQEDDDDKFKSFMQQPAKPKAHSKSSGGASGIIGILQVAESDIAKSLSALQAEEDDSQQEYEEVTQKNKIAAAEKAQAIKYKTQEYKALDKSIVDMSGDLGSVDKELAAVNEYYAKIKGKCVAKPESYEAREKRRKAEIAGLKEALEVLESETALVQRGSSRRSSRRSLRGARGTLAARASSPA